MKNYKTQYDKLILQSVGNNHLLDLYPYYDQDYRQKLEREICRRKQTDAFGPFEFQTDSNGRTKMCAVASSSRIGFLYGIQEGITGFEKKDVTNEICRPHYDNYDEKNRVFLEYKCHEFTSEAKAHNCFPSNPEGYKKLLEKYFEFENYDSDDLHKSFGFEPYLYFDFKQFLCHILGLLKVAETAEPNKKLTLQYVMFTPKQELLDQEQNREIREWLEKLKDNVNDIFRKFEDRKVKVANHDTGKISDYITLNFKYQDISEVKDIIYDSLDN